MTVVIIIQIGTIVISLLYFLPGSRLRLIAEKHATVLKDFLEDDNGQWSRFVSISSPILLLSLEKLWRNLHATPKVLKSSDIHHLVHTLKGGKEIKTRDFLVRKGSGKKGE